MNDSPDGVPGNGPMAAYKRLLQGVCDSRPSGTRMRLAAALGTNRSFVSQLANPAYTVPIPVQHLQTIFEVCHFTPQERAAFLTDYDRAHPGRRETMEAPVRTRVIPIVVPDLGRAGNDLIDEMAGDFARTLVKLASLIGSVPD